jgi:hypothetical protein
MSWAVAYPASRTCGSDVGEDAGQRPGYPGEVERSGEHVAVVDLPARAGAQEAVQLLFAGPGPLGGLLGEGAERAGLERLGFFVSIAAAPSERISSSSRSVTQTKKPSRSRPARPGPGASPARSRPRRKAGSSPSSHSPASRTPCPRGPNTSRKCPMLVAPPIGSTNTPSPLRSRPRRPARVASAAWSLRPSTSTTAAAPASDGSSVGCVGTGSVSHRAASGPEPFSGQRPGAGDSASSSRRSRRCRSGTGRRPG